MVHTAVNRRRSCDRIEAPGKEYADYVVCGPKGRRTGRVKEFFTNARGEPEYAMVKMSLFGMRSILIPVGFVSVDEGR